MLGYPCFRRLGIGLLSERKPIRLTLAKADLHFPPDEKKALLSQDLFLCVGAEGDPIFIYRVWHTAGLVRSGYRRGYKKRYAGPTLNLNESERERLWCDLSVTRCETMLTLNEVMDWLCSSQRNVLL